MVMLVMVGWRTFLASGIVVAVAFLLAPGGLAQALLFIGMSGAALVALVVGVHRHQPAPTGAWWMLAVSFAAYWLAVVGWALYLALSSRPLPFPSLLDPLFWVAYLGWFGFLAAVVRAHAREAGSVTDTLVVAGGVAVAGWAVLIAPVLTPDLSTGVQVATVTYPVLLTALAAMAVRAAIAPAHASILHGLLVGWIGLELVGDVWYSLASAAGTFHLGSPWSVTWLLGYTALGTMVLHPRLPELTQVLAVDRPPTRQHHLAVLTVAGLLPMVTLLVWGLTGHGEHGDTIVVRVVSIGIFLAIMVRLGRSTFHLAAERELREELEHVAVHDILTGAVNRVGFDQALRRALATRHAEDRTAMVFIADLDGFKDINDTYGHEAGDKVLCEVTRRLRDGVRAADTVGRLGGDEFAVVVDDIELAQGIALADRLATAVTEPIELDTTTATMGVSLGVYPLDPNDDPDRALRRADAAMYAAKDAGGGVELYEAERHRAVLDRYHLERQLRAAPAAGQLVVHYQPVHRLSDLAVVSVEALVRWDHPKRGWLLPGAFMDLAERSGAILDVDRWVLHEACRAAVAWQRDGDGVGVAVNLSRRHLQDERIVEDVREALAASGLDPHLLTLEITESAVSSDIEMMIDVMHQLAGLGVQLAMDDFGTGYSSLGDLRRMPVNLLKLDRSLVGGTTATDEEWAVAAAVFRLATSLGKRTLAEGIEDTGQLEQLRRFGCELGQGYLLDPPLPIQDLREVLCRDALRYG